MLIDSREPQFSLQGNTKVPIAGPRRDELKALRLLGPQGQPLQEWEREWRAGHTSHYRELILGLQRMAPEDRLLDIRAQALLVGARLDREDLTGLDLRNMNLTNASLRGTDLTETNLAGALLVKADFSRSCLLRANLTAADLSGADCSMAYSKSALYERAVARRTWFRHTYLDGALFFDADLRLADFNHARLWGAMFDNANLEETSGLDTAIFVRWLKPGLGQVWSDIPKDGWAPIFFNPMGPSTYQVNAGRQND